MSKSERNDIERSELDTPRPLSGLILSTLSTQSIFLCAVFLLNYGRSWLATTSYPNASLYTILYSCLYTIAPNLYSAIHSHNLVRQAGTEPPMSLSIYQVCIKIYKLSFIVCLQNFSPLSDSEYVSRFHFLSEFLFAYSLLPWYSKHLSIELHFCCFPISFHLYPIFTII